MATSSEALQGNQNGVESVLTEVGLSDVEVSVYKAALSLGSRPASTIAQKAGLKRGHTYNVLHSLMEKGIVQEYVRNSVRHFTCSPPRSLLSIVQRRQDELASHKEQLLKVIPQLEDLRNPLSADPKVRFFKGPDAIKEIFDDMILVPDQTIYAVVDLQYSWSTVDENTQSWVKNFIKRREERNICWYGIGVKSDISDNAIRYRESKLRKMKMLEGVSFPAEMHVYGSKLAITSTYSEMIGVIIQSEPIAQTLRNMIQLLWDVLPDYSFNNAEAADTRAA